MKKILIITLILLIGVSFTSCYKYKGNLANNVYNNDELVASEANTLSVSDTKEEVGEDSYDLDIVLIGSGTVWTYESDKDFDLDMNYNLSVNKGKAKIVFIDPNKKITLIKEEENKSDKVESTKLSIKQGKNYIKVVGEKEAKLKTHLSIGKGEFNKIFGR